MNSGVSTQQQAQPFLFSLTALAPESPDLLGDWQPDGERYCSLGGELPAQISQRNSMSSCVRMPQRSPGIDTVADALLDFLRFGETSLR